MFKLEFLRLFLLTVETLRAEIVYDWQLYSETTLCSHDEGHFSNAGSSSSFIFHIDICTVLSLPPIKGYFISALSMRQAPWTKHLDLFSIDVRISFSLVPTLSLSALPALSRFHLLPGDLSRSMRPAAAITAGYQVSVIFCVLPSPLSLDPLTKSWETFLKSICLSWFPQPLIQALLLSLRIWEWAFTSLLGGHICPPPNSILSASQPETPWRIQTGSRLSSVHSLSRVLPYTLTLWCCPFIFDHTERDSRSNW